MSYSNNNINIKKILTNQETHQISFDTIPNPLSLKLVKILRNFLFPKFGVKYWTVAMETEVNVPLDVMFAPQ